MTPRRLLLLPLVAAILLVAGCGGGSGATSTATPPTTSAGASTIPTATPFATVPAAEIVTATAGGGAEITYTVQPGDSLLAIASRFGSTVGAIQARNNLTGTDIYVGQELVIPSEGATAPAPVVSVTVVGTGNTYVVQGGDTASGIAATFNVTLEALAAANGMTVADLNSLREGQTLQIPSP